MRTDYLRYFIDVVSLGSMNAAAKKNFMTPQGISRSITALEVELGCKLFERDSNKVALTHFGQQLLKDSQALLAHESSMRHTIRELLREDLQKLRTRFVCHCNPLFFETPLLYPASGLGYGLYGNVQFLQCETNTTVATLAQEARNTQADTISAAGFAFYSTFPEDNARVLQKLSECGCTYQPLLRTPLFALAPAYTTIARKQKATTEQLRAFPLALAPAKDMTRAILRTIGEDIRVFASAGDSAYRAHLCRMGEALTFVPGTSLAFDLPDGTAEVPMEKAIDIEIGFAAAPESMQEGLLANIVKSMRSFYAEYEDSGYCKLLDISAYSSF